MQQPLQKNAKELEPNSIESELNGIRNELNGLKKKGAKQVASIFVSVVFSLIIGLGGGIYCGQHWDDIMLRFFPQTYADETTTILKSKLDSEAKLNTGIYTATAHYDSGKLTGTIPIIGKLAKKSFSFDYSGSVEAGIADLSDHTVDINSATNTITITLPAIEITNVNVDASSLGNTTQTKNIFNQLTIEDFNHAQEVLQNNLKDSALKGDIIGKAQKNAENVLRELFGKAIVGYDVLFVFE